MSTELVEAKRLPVPKTEGAEGVIGCIDRIIAGAPSGIDRSQFANAIVAAANESDIADCTRASVMMAAYNTVQIGLMPGKTLGLSYFVKHWNGRAKANECTLIIGYKGYLTLAYENNFLLEPYANVVCKGEEFEFYVDNGPRLIHRPALDRNPTPENITHAYCVAKTVKGGIIPTFLTRERIDQISKKQRESKGFNPWKDPQTFHEMCSKSAIRACSKWWKLNQQLARAVELDEQSDRGEQQVAPDFEPGDVTVTSSEPQIDLTDEPDTQDVPELTSVEHAVQHVMDDMKIADASNAEGLLRDQAGEIYQLDLEACNPDQLRAVIAAVKG